MQIEAGLDLTPTVERGNKARFRQAHTPRKILYCRDLSRHNPTSSVRVVCSHVYQGVRFTGIGFGYYRFFSERIVAVGALDLADEFVVVPVWCARRACGR